MGFKTFSILSDEIWEKGFYNLFDIFQEPAKFSELQIQSYLKTVAFRREIDQVQKCAAGKSVGGVQTSKIASEANREFIFSSSFTGDKQ
jgi:DNA excision repair protein ERCC-5